MKWTTAPTDPRFRTVVTDARLQPLRAHVGGVVPPFPAGLGIQPGLPPARELAGPGPAGLWRGEALAATRPASAPRCSVFVDANHGNDGNDGAAPTALRLGIGPKRTLAAGVRVTAGGGTCYLAPGSYPASGVRIAAAMHLVGAGPDRTEIVATSGTAPLLVVRVGVAPLGGSDVAVSNLALRGGTTALLIERSSEVVVENCVVGPGATWGVAVLSSSRVRLMNVTVVHNDSGVLLQESHTVAMVDSVVAFHTGVGLQVDVKTCQTLIFAYNDTFANGGDQLRCRALPDFPNYSFNPLIDRLDARPRPESPCVDAGAPLVEFNDLDGSRNDLGAYGGPGAFRAAEAAHLVFRVSPLAGADIRSITPLGDLSPTQHVFPNRGAGFYIRRSSDPNDTSSPAALVNVVAPTRLRVRRIEEFFDVDGADPSAQYDLTFELTGGNDDRLPLEGDFGHLVFLSERLARAFKQGWDPVSTDRSPGGTRIEGQARTVQVVVDAGELLGVAGGPRPGLTFQLRDPCVPRPPLAQPPGTSTLDRRDGHVVCPYDRFTREGGLQARLRAKLGTADLEFTSGGYCGRPYQDVAGTVQGIWFNAAVPVAEAWSNEAPHIAFVRDNVVPSLGVVSIGTAFEAFPEYGLRPGKYYVDPDVDFAGLLDGVHCVTLRRSFFNEMLVYTDHESFLRQSTAFRVRLTLDPQDGGDGARGGYSVLTVEVLGANDPCFEGPLSPAVVTFWRTVL